MLIFKIFFIVGVPTYDYVAINYYESTKELSDRMARLATGYCYYLLHFLQPSCSTNSFLGRIYICTLISVQKAIDTERSNCNLQDLINRV